MDLCREVNGFVPKGLWICAGCPRNPVHRRQVMPLLVLKVNAFVQFATCET